MYNKNNLSVITNVERTRLINAIQVTSVDHSPQRLLKELLKVHPGPLPTLDVNKICAIGNISHIANTVNCKIIKHGWFIGCSKPATPFKNRFGQHSQMHLWALHKLPEAANDDSYSLIDGE